MSRRVIALLLSVLGLFAVLGGTPARAADPEPPVTGIPEPCSAQREWPKGASLSAIKRKIERTYGFDLTGDGWTKERYRPLVKIIWQTFDAVDCTPYLTTVKKRVDGTLALNASATRSSWSLGDWGLTKPGAITFDFAKWLPVYKQGDSGRLVRIVIHEMGHVYHMKHGRFWNRFESLYASKGRLSDYGWNDMETFGDAVGYYVGRCAKNNPYSRAKSKPYYDYVKKTIFGGKEFGPEPGAKVDCTLKVKVPAPKPVAPPKGAAVDGIRVSGS